jgi:hypothetical protein
MGDAASDRDGFDSAEKREILSIVSRKTNLRKKAVGGRAESGEEFSTIADRPMVGRWQ